MKSCRPASRGTGRWFELTSFCIPALPLHASSGSCDVRPNTVDIGSRCVRSIAGGATTDEPVGHWSQGNDRSIRLVLYGAGEFLGVQEYKNVQRWADAIAIRPAVRRGRMVNRTSGEPSSQLHERHDVSDFETRTLDKVEDGQPTTGA
jgi:hypothetical protein